MLERISIKNYAVIDNLELTFKNGLSVFTGETGAGKSVLIGALGLLLGSRSDFSMIRSGEEILTVEGEFTISHPETITFLRHELSDFDNTLIIRREIHQNGKSRVFINSNQETLSKLEKIGDRLADMHGQHDHQLLLNPKVHGDILDSFGGLYDDVKKFSEIYEQTIAKKEEKEVLEQNADQLRREKEYYENAHQEIQNANLKINEDQELDVSLTRMQNHENIFSMLNQAYQGLYEAEINASNILDDSQKTLQSIASYDQKYLELSEMVMDALVKTKETSRLLSSYLQEMDFNPEDLDAVLDRIALIKELKRKYQKDSIEDLLTFSDQCLDLLNKADNLDQEQQKLAQEYNTLLNQLGQEALALSKKRQHTAENMKTLIEKELSFLEMNSQFDVKISYVKKEDSFLVLNNMNLLVSAKGIDKVEFLISANVGEEPKPLAKIASGGEISRVMLSIKSALASGDPIGTGIFDEIDAGIGGMVAHNVALKMKEIAQIRQIFCITHLAQIASKADYHYHVKKEQIDNRTFTHVVELTYNERIKEIARMLGGEGTSSETLAKELLDNK